MADALEIPFIDLDTYIEQRQEEAVAQIFEKRGELFFRQLESESLAEVLLRNDDLVLAAGGGTPCYGRNMQKIVEKAEHSVYLQATVPTLVTRLEKEKDHRPLIQGMSQKRLKAFIEGHLSKRKAFYMQAKHVIVVDNKTVETIVSEIKDVLT